MNIVILGGGISGLSAAWSLRKKYPDARIALLEKQGRLGGAIQTLTTNGLLFELGPRTFPVSRSSALLALIRELGLQDEILFSSKQARQRYLWYRGQLRPLSALYPRLIPALLQEPFRAKGTGEDESIAAFVRRRFRSPAAEVLFDAITLGIFAGDIHELSLRSCFPRLHAWEQTKGSIVMGFLTRPKQQDKGLFTLRRGMGSLIAALQSQLSIDIHLNCSVTAIHPQGVEAGGVFWPAGQIISALPAPEIGQITKRWLNFSSRSLWVVLFAFPAHSFTKQGFGYLVPTQEKEFLLGVIWDSSLFPEQGQEVRLTAMVRHGGDRAWALTTAQEA